VRVIGGSLRGRRLTAPAGLATRPTADRIRESIFNILAGRIEAKRVLDLFAGTGALGIEALSRGAANAVFVDQAKIALTALRRNLRALDLEDRARVCHWNILKNLNCLAAERPGFDLVFMDPPYETHAMEPALASLAASGALTPGACIVLEHSAREPLVIPVAELVLKDQRRFGKTLVSFMDTML
jgi:16S rRNA (guanine966-N2)-methyltransferase